MVLLNARDNVDLGNKPFQEKRSILKASPFLSTSEVAKQRTWGPKQIESRQTALSEYAPEVWPI
jgi:hypothetical protein